jgi:hypothetical protein
VRIALNSTSEVRRAPAVGRPNGRGWLLVSQHDGEDIYGRPLNLVANAFLYAPGDKPQPWPPTAVCARLLRSGDVRKKEWYADMRRAVGGRLRPWALAVVASSECEPQFGLPALAATSTLALLASRLTVRAVLGPSG